MKSYLVRTIKGKSTDSYIGVFASKGQTDLFWEVDKEINPYICEYAELDNSCVGIGMFTKINVISSENDDEYIDIELDLAKGMQSTSGELAEALDDDGEDYAWVKFRDTFKRAPVANPPVLMEDTDMYAVYTIANECAVVNNDTFENSEDKLHQPEMVEHPWNMIGALLQVPEHKQSEFVDQVTKLALEIREASKLEAAQ